ncbi:odorant receptor 65a-like [Drosophila busckii]|uniref:odorant receptor 65a-like n=1 Tax=Drosophila busckii TaxID=30019 RepID=UPI0014331F0F|nr:odorant receptor 65a-like [Drosophila busckii]
MDFGQDLLWIISATYILAKITFFHFRGTELNKLLEELDMLHCELKTAHGHVAAYEQRLWFFNFESALVILWHCGLALFSILFITLPLWTQQNLPFHAVVPFELHDPIKHPWGHVCIFLWQGCSFVYNLAVNLRVLCIELNSFAPELQNNTQRFQAELKRLIQFHQRLISMIYRTNKVLFLPQIMQMTTGVLQICLSAFVSLAIQNNPAVYKFIVFLILSLVYVSYWCTLGDLVTAQSLEVAVAAYNIIEWAPCSAEIQRDIAFMILRAQIPLHMQAQPFPPVNFASNMYLLKNCYSILTLLLKTLD